MKPRIQTIRISDIFVVRDSGGVNKFRREADDPAPMFECERVRITHLACSFDPKMKPYTFGAEPEWFKQRNLVALDGRCENDETYHVRIRSDAMMFDAEAVPIGRQKASGMVLDLGLCPGCGTTVSKMISEGT